MEERDANMLEVVGADVCLWLNVIEVIIYFIADLWLTQTIDYLVAFSL